MCLVPMLCVRVCVCVGGGGLSEKEKEKTGMRREERMFVCFINKRLDCWSDIIIVLLNPFICHWSNLQCRIVDKMFHWVCWVYYIHMGVSNTHTRAQVYTHTHTHTDRQKQADRTTWKSTLRIKGQTTQFSEASKPKYTTQTTQRCWALHIYKHLHKASTHFKYTARPQEHVQIITHSKARSQAWLHTAAPSLQPVRQHHVEDQEATLHTQHSSLCSTYSTLPRLPVRCPSLLGAGAVPVCAETQTGETVLAVTPSAPCNQMDSFISQQGSFSVSRKGTTIQWCVTFYFVPPQNRNCAMTIYKSLSIC